MSPVPLIYVPCVVQAVRHQNVQLIRTANLAISFNHAVRSHGGHCGDGRINGTFHKRYLRLAAEMPYSPPALRSRCADSQAVVDRRVATFHFESEFLVLPTRPHSYPRYSGRWRRSAALLHGLRFS
ncbi:hypothetical protein HMPREF0591_2071 [Mycobacterium parascrofulaceum ATCC BAA-614]|uniref:Uncharacterized protein n=1 Tax=Mycobacterium parascrofulaceum ATCC BAA-614 TaxID=525368 RepID=D5P7C7_9MYCO|nr:hypothetical protein HMPREF0591_2071 [Mycobacterium parascrofulaceum ATCC BAA-614]